MGEKYRWIPLAGVLMVGMSLPLAAQTSGMTDTAPAAPQSGAPTAPGSTLSDSTVQKAGAALRDIAAIQQSYSQQAQAAPTPSARQELSQQAEVDAVKAVNAKGLSVDQYNQVIRMAQNDPGLKQRLISAAQTAK